MTATLASIFADLLPDLTLGSGEQPANDQSSIAGLSLRTDGEGALELAIRSLEFTGLLGSFTHALGATGHAPAPGAAWSLAPLAAANGAIRAQIVDAHLLFDADVTVPVRERQIPFSDATVEHVGPDSRMGVSRLGVFVDAPNGRSYLYQFASTPVAGVAFERRGALPGARPADRGSLRLQEFVEGLLQAGPGAKGPGFTEQARLLLARTSLSGELRLGDGKIAAPGMQAELVGRAQGRNAIQLTSGAVGRGLSAELALLAVRDVLFHAGGVHLKCDEITGTLKLRMSFEAGRVRVDFELAKLTVAGLRMRWQRPAGVTAG